MKRIGAILCLSVMLIMMSVSVCFAGEGDLKINELYPKDGATGTAVESISIKLWFNQDVKPKSQEIRKENKQAIKLVDDKGKTIPIYVAYSQKEKGLRPCVFPGFLKREEVLAGNGGPDLPETFLESPDGHGKTLDLSRDI